MKVGNVRTYGENDEERDRNELETASQGYRTERGRIEHLFNQPTSDTRAAFGKGVCRSASIGRLGGFHVQISFEIESGIVWIRNDYYR